MRKFIVMLFCSMFALGILFAQDSTAAKTEMKNDEMSMKKETKKEKKAKKSSKAKKAAAKKKEATK